MLVREMFYDSYHNGLPETNLLLFRDWLDLQISKIPPEYLKYAEIDLWCDGTDTYLDIEYYRELTDEESEKNAPC